MPISAALGSSALLPAGLGFRNILINGDMRVAQRSTSVAGLTTSSAPQACDRWAVQLNGLGTWTVSQDTDAPSGFAYSTKLLCTTADSSPAAGDYLQFEQRIEGLNITSLSYGTANAKPVTVSFWVKSNVLGTFICRLYGPSSGRAIHNAFTINAANTWEYKTVQFVGDITGSYPVNNTESLRFTFWLGAGSTFTSGTLNTSWATYVAANSAAGCTNFAASSNNYVSFTGLQLEQNTQPTPFEQRPYGVELQLCQRYFVRIIGSEVTNGTLLFCRGSDARPTVYYQLPVPPRATGAQITESGQSYVSNLWTNVVAVSNISQINTSPSSNIVSWCWTTWSSLTAEKVYIWNPNNSNVSISMEL